MNGYLHFDSHVKQITLSNDPLSAVGKMLMGWGQDWVEIVITTIQENTATCGGIGDIAA